MPYDTPNMWMKIFVFWYASVIVFGAAASCISIAEIKHPVIIAARNRTAFIISDNTSDRPVVIAFKRR